MIANIALHKQEYEEKGFTIFREVLSKALLDEIHDHILWLQKKFPEFPPEHLHHPLSRDDAFWVRVVTDDKLLDIVELFLGENIACFTTHYICKPPTIGQAVLWHQDGGYWKLDPMQAVAMWIAIDRSSEENGCLKMIPGSHKSPLEKIILRNDVPNVLGASIHDDGVDLDNVVDIELNPGDLSIHHPNLIHCSGPNHSKKRRCGLNLGYMPTSTSISNKGLYLHPILARGEPIENINEYRAWPEYNINDSMAFSGNDSWNEKISAINQKHNGIQFKKADDESVVSITRRMMQRLKEGKTKS